MGSHADISVQEHNPGHASATTTLAQDAHGYGSMVYMSEKNRATGAGRGARHARRAPSHWLGDGVCRPSTRPQRQAAAAALGAWWPGHQLHHAQHGQAPRDAGHPQCRHEAGPRRGPGRVCRGDPVRLLRCLLECKLQHRMGSRGVFTFRSPAGSVGLATSLTFGAAWGFCAPGDSCAAASTLC